MPQCIHRKRDLLFEQLKINTGSPIRDKPPCIDRIGGTVGLNATPDSDIINLCFGILLASKFQPKITNRLFFVATRQHPGFQHPGLLACRIDTTGFAGQQERQQHIHRRRLTRAVNTTQQQPPVPKAEDFVFVLINISDAGTTELPARRKGHGLVTYCPTLMLPPIPDQLTSSDRYIVTPLLTNSHAS